jgi:epoxyqueuosine reductase
MKATGAHTMFVKKTATAMGFEFCGIAKAAYLDDDARRLEQWLSNGMHGSMSYMQNHFDLRIDPSRLVPGAKSVITLMLNYYPEHRQQDGVPRISKYAFGEDYHEVIRKKLRMFLETLRTEIGEINGRGFVDSAPVLERSWAARSGLGWIGRNGNLINQRAGSFYFIATIITDLELDADDPIAKDYCGTCTRCIDACPTGAILDNKVVDGSRCISYYTIELKETMDASSLPGSFDNWMFGCDTCQDVCPWNRFSSPTKEEGFKPLEPLMNFSLKDWEELTEETFKSVFRNSPLKRAKYSGIRRNLSWLAPVKIEIPS